MIFATLREGGADGTLLVVSRSRSRAVRVESIATTLQSALDNWNSVAPRLQAIADDLNAGKAADAFDIDLVALMAPLPRAFAFFDAGCYPHHMIPIRQARGAKMPEEFYEKPIMYQGCSAPILSATEPMLAEDEAWELDIEAELVVITSEVPAGIKREAASACIRLLGLYNDFSLRTLIAPELRRGFGFVQSKPVSSMAPFVITPDEAGTLWNGSVLGGHYRLHVRGQQIGDLDPSKDIIHTYPDLIVHAARTRPLTAGTLLAAGTLANEDRRHGCGCIAELRAREQLADGEPRTPYLSFGDDYRMELLDDNGISLFGAIQQRVQKSVAAKAMN